MTKNLNPIDVAHAWHNYFYIFIGILLTLALLAVVPKEKFEPRGIALPVASILNNHSTLSNPDQIQIIEQTDEFNTLSPLAYIHVENHYDKVSQQKLIETLNFAKQVAAQVGATKLIIKQLGYVPPHQTDQAMLLYSFTGIAAQ